jgi:hypothetical protein
MCRGSEHTNGVAQARVCSCSAIFPSIQPLASSNQPPASSHHGRRCTVCSRPLRDAIEADFLRWRSPEEITREYRLVNRSTIYRHANAAGLFHRRKEQFARVLEYFLEQAEICSLVDANVVIRAARVYAHLDYNGKRIESPRTNYIYHGPAPLLLENAPDLDPTIPAISTPARLHQLVGAKFPSTRVTAGSPKPPSEEKTKGEEKALARRSPQAKAANRNTRPLRNR